MLSGARLQQIARDAAAALDDVSRGHPFTAHLDVWKVGEKVFLIVTDDDPDLQIILSRPTRITAMLYGGTTTRSPPGTTSTSSTGSPSVQVGVSRSGSSRIWCTAPMSLLPPTARGLHRE